MTKYDLLSTESLTEQEITEAIQNNAFYINQVEKTPDRCMTAVKKGGYVLKFIPKNMQTAELCLTAVKQDGCALRHVSKKLLTYEICLEAIQQNGMALMYVPKKFMNYEFCIEAVTTNGRALCCISKDMITKELCLKAILQKGEALQYVPSRLKTKNLCSEAVRNNGGAIEYVPNRFKTQELYLEAIDSSGMALEYMPEYMRSYDVCLKAVKNNGLALCYVPENVCTIDHCIEALKENKNSVRFIPDRMKHDKTILEMEKLFGIRKITIKSYNKDNKKFIVGERVFGENEEREFEKFSDFYTYLKGDLTDSDLSDFDFENIDLREYNIEGVGINSKVLREQGLYNDFFYEENIGKYNECTEFDFSAKNEQIEAASILHAENFEALQGENVIKIYYISDIHLNHKIKKRFPEFATKWETVAYIKKVIEKMIETAGERGRVAYLLVAGDISYNFEISKIFYMELAKQWDPHRIIVVLGNHELWDFNQDGKPTDSTYTAEGTINRYCELFNNLEIKFLQNELLICTDKNVKKISENQLKSIDTNILRELCLKSSLMVLGGLGYSGLNDEFNATHGIYRYAVQTLEDDIKQTKRFESVYEKVEAALDESPVIVLTHTPKENWTNRNYKKNWIYVNGHTHRNDYECGEEKTVYSDNQIGYTSQSIGLKYFQVSGFYDIFKYYKDGIYEISREQYLDFNRGMNINITFNRTDGFIDMLKNCGIYCFIFETYKGLYLLNGGKIKKLATSDINYYFTNLTKYSDCVKKMLYDYNAALKSIANSIKAIGGSGIIHGCIVDIDYYNHIYLNPNDGTITPYYATSITKKYISKDVQTLLLEHRPDLYKKYQQVVNRIEKNELVYITDTKAGLTNITRLVTDTHIYRPSRIIKELQYLTNDNVVRVWYDQLINDNFDMECQRTDGLLENHPGLR